MKKTILAIFTTSLIGYIADMVFSLLFRFSFLKSILDFTVKVLSIRVPVWSVVIFLLVIIAALFIAFLERKAICKRIYYRPILRLDLDMEVSAQ